MTFIYITCKDKKEAKRLSDHLLKKRLIACTNFFPIESSYLWKGRIVNDKEYALLAKTIEKNHKKVEQEIKRIHSYEVPSICMIKSRDNIDYHNWINRELKTKK